MYVLGINAVYHDSAACLVADGQVVAAAEEERFNRVKHGKRPIPFSTYELPFHAVDYCLREAGIVLADVDHVAYSYRPEVLLGERTGSEKISLPLEPSAHAVPDDWEAAWDPLFVSSIVNAPRHLAGGVPHHLKARFTGVTADGPYRWHFVEHHRAHAASAFLASPFERAAVLTLDGRGEKATTTYSLGHGDTLDQLGVVEMPHSLGLLYEQVTSHLGFLHSSDEYKVMALASFGRPAFLDALREAVRVGPGGAYTVGQLDLEGMVGPARQKGGALEPGHYDLAHSLQACLEETVLQLAYWLHQVTGERDLCLSGGVALNCVMNARLRDRGPFSRIWVQPAAGDAGTAVGAALLVETSAEPAAGTARASARDGHETRAAAGSNGGPRAEVPRSSRLGTMDHVFLGPSYSPDEIEEFLVWSKLPFRRLENVAGETADLLADDLIIGWFQGRMEFGPRALGARSILASPLHEEMRDRLNEIKDREDFRPVAPVVLEEEAPGWFKDAGRSPFMLFVYDVLPDKAALIPAVRHVDGTARIQTINRGQHPLYYDLLRAFQERTGVPVLVNTSFNTRGEPIVCSPRDAVECFWTSPLDALVIGPFVLEKKALRAPYGRHTAELSSERSEGGRQ
jgi:carbamoyltransferase